MINARYLDLKGLELFWTNAKKYIDTVDTAIKAAKVDRTQKVNGNALGTGDITVQAVQVPTTAIRTKLNVQESLAALDAALKAVEDSYVKTFDGKKQDITVEKAATDGNINFDTTGNKLTGAVKGWETIARKATSISTVEFANVVTAGKQNVTVDINVTGTMGDAKAMPAKTTKITLPAATTAEHGVITLQKITDIAVAEANKAATSAYKVRGTKATLAEVLAVPSAVIGDVYNVAADFDLNGKHYPASTNVVFIGAEAGNDPKQPTQWDALGGTVDLTPFDTIVSVDNKIKALRTSLTEALNAAKNALEASKVARTQMINSTAYGEGNIELSGQDIFLADGTGNPSNTHAGAHDLKVRNANTVTGALQGLDAALKTVEGSYVRTFAGKKQDITLRTAVVYDSAKPETEGKINLSMNGNELGADITGLKNGAFTEWKVITNEEINGLAGFTPAAPQA